MYGAPESRPRGSFWGKPAAHSYDLHMIELGRRSRNQPAPPHVIFEALTQPHRDPSRPWLALLDDEQEPVVVHSVTPNLVVWSSLWPHRPSARIRFALTPDGGSGTDLQWTLEAEPPAPDESAIGHMRKRINELINANLRYSFGQ